MAFSNPFEDFCDVEGLTVDQVGLFQSRLKIRTARSGLDYFLEHITVDETLTGADSGRSVTIHTAYLAKDSRFIFTSEAMFLCSTEQAVLTCQKSPNSASTMDTSDSGLAAGIGGPAVRSPRR